MSRPQSHEIVHPGHSVRTIRLWADESPIHNTRRTSNAGGAEEVAERFAEFVKRWRQAFLLKSRGFPYHKKQLPTEIRRWSHDAGVAIW